LSFVLFLLAIVLSILLQYTTKIDDFYDNFWYFYSLRSKRSLKKCYKNQKGQSRNTANIGHTTKQES
jgi:hypothetical protein